MLVSAARAKAKSPLITALSKIKGVMFCLGCRSWRYPHACDGTPAVSLRWEWAYTTAYVGTPHHNPIDPSWTELEAEEAKQSATGGRIAMTPTTAWLLMLLLWAIVAALAAF